MSRVPVLCQQKDVQVGDAMHDNTVAPWHVRVGPFARALRAAPIANGDLRPEPALRSECAWQIAGPRPSFELDLHALGRALPAGWYALRGRMRVEAGRIELPSVHLHYAAHSAMTDAEVMLPPPDKGGRIAALLLFLEAVESIEFVPGIAAARFTLGDFRLRRVSRLEALSAMLAQPAGAGKSSRARRLGRWFRVVRRRGLKRATDDLHVDYLRRMWPARFGEYGAWVRKYDTLTGADRDDCKRRALALRARGPLISLLLVVHDATDAELRSCLESVLAQAWESWELCIAGRVDRIGTVLDAQAARDVRIRIVPEGDRSGSLDAALAQARGDFVAPLQDREVLRPHALLRFAEVVADDPGVAVMYPDEDRLDDAGKRFGPDFKPDWNPDLLLSRDYIGSRVAIRTMVARAAGGFRGDAAYDLVLRCSESVPAGSIRHIAEILWQTRPPRVERAAGARGPSGAADESRAVAEHLARIGASAVVQTFEHDPPLRHLRWKLPAIPPRVSVIVPTRDRAALLRTCVQSLLAKTSYPDFEVVVVDNQSRQRATLRCLEQLAEHPRVRVLRYDLPFNYSAINNWAAAQCDGPLLGFVNNDIEVITPDWLEEMAGLATRAHTGAVGAMLYYPDDHIQHAGMVLGLDGVAGHVYAGKPRGWHGRAERARVAQDMSAVTGACLLVRRAVFEEAGGFDEKLPIEFNDTDLCLRLLSRGYRNIWTPFAELYHHESASRSVGGARVAKKRFDEVGVMLQRWRGLLRDDPAYNPNLSLCGLDCRLAFPRRTRMQAATAHRP